MNTWRTILIPGLLALTLGGCSMFASAPETPRTDPLLALQGDIDAVRRENEQLRVYQGQQSEKLQALEKQLAQEREAHKRYRDMMATNFEMLEQSVAETLSSRQPTAAAQPASAQAMQPAAVQSGVSAATPAVATMLTPQEAQAADQEAARRATAAMAAKRAAEQADKQPKAAPAMAPAPAVTSAPTPQATKATQPGPVILPVAAADNAPFSDPDLTPPQEARPLEAHPEAKALYERGFSLFAHKQYDEAIAVYTSFLQQFPNDIYSDNAQFWIGEAHLRSQRMTDAEAAFRLVLRHFEHRSTLEGAKTPDAILRIGQIKSSAGNPKRAQYYFANAAERFPDSSAGRKAQQELDSLRQNTADAASVQPRS